MLQQPLQDAVIEVGPWLEIGDGDSFVQLVNRRIDRPQLDDFAADVGDEATVRCPTGARKLRLNRTDVANHVADDLDQSAARRQIRPSRTGPTDVVVKPVLAQHILKTSLQALAAACRGVPEVERKLQRPGDDVGRTCAGLDVRRLPGRRRKILVAIVPADRRELGDRRRREVDRVPRQVRIGDVALHPAHGQRSRQRPAAPVLDHVAEPVNRRWLADNAVIQRLARGAQLVDDPDRAISRRTFLVRGDHERDRPGVVRRRLGQTLDGDDECGE